VARIVVIVAKFSQPKRSLRFSQCTHIHPVVAR